MEYKDISRILNQVFNKNKSNLSNNQKVLIDNYLRLLKHEISMEDVELQRICNDIYKKHSAALDLLFTYKENPAKTIIRYAINWIDKLKPISQDKLQFVTKDLQDYLGENHSFKHFYYYIEVRYDKKNDRVSVNFSLVFHKDSNLDDETEKKILSIDSNIPNNFVWRRSFSGTRYFNPEEEEKAVHDFLDKHFKSIVDKIKVVLR